MMTWYRHLLLLVMTWYRQFLLMMIVPTVTIISDDMVLAVVTKGDQGS